MNQTRELLGQAAANAAKSHCSRGHEFTEENTRIYRERRHCRECNRARDRRIYAERTRFVAGLKTGLPCVDCGAVKAPDQMHFHHEDTPNPLGRTQGAFRRKWSEERIRQEIERCVLLCNSCHHRRHYLRGDLGRKRRDGQGGAK